MKRELKEKKADLEALVRRVERLLKMRGEQNPKEKQAMGETLADLRDKIESINRQLKKVQLFKLLSP